MGLALRDDVTLKQIQPSGAVIIIIIIIIVHVIIVNCLYQQNVNQIARFLFACLDAQGGWGDKPFEILPR